MAKAQARALRLLAARDRSAHELRHRLGQAGFSDDATEEAVAWCRRLGYIDDLRFARNWIEYRILHSPSGRLRLELELRQKGVGDEVIARALDEMLPFDRERQLCIDTALRRARRFRNVPADVRTRRLSQFLSRRGFAYDMIRQALAEVDTHSDTD